MFHEINTYANLRCFHFTFRLTKKCALKPLALEGGLALSSLADSQFVPLWVYIAGPLIITIYARYETYATFLLLF